MKGKTTYLDIPYKNSICCSTTESCNEKEQLLRRKAGAENAIQYHEKEKNPTQIIFFNENLQHVNKKLKKFK